MTLRPFSFVKSIDFISSRFGAVSHDVAIVLGSGLGGLVSHLTDKRVLRTTEIPDYPRSTVPGHVGEIVSARLGAKNVLIFSGRVHFYESGSTVASAVTALVSHGLGIKTFVLTNAAGILNRSFSPGNLMVIRDQINLTFRNVLRGTEPGTQIAGPVYSRRLEQVAMASAEETGVALKSGIYLGLTGPSYETPAEVKMYRLIGGDAIGMSTIHEATYACSVGMEVLGISCLTNYSTGIGNQKLSHTEVMEVGTRVGENFSKLLLNLVGLL